MANLPWLRLYSDIVDNEKIRLIAFEDRWHYIAILACKQQGVLGGKFVERKLAIKLGLQLRELDEVKRRLLDVELIDEDWQPIGWEDHQFKSDNSTERVKKFRNKNNMKHECNVSSPLLKRKSNALDTDTDKDKDKDKSICARETFSETCRKVREAVCKIQLSPTDFEIIKSWVDFTTEEIDAACATTRTRGGKSVRYIDTVLRETRNEAAKQPREQQKATSGGRVIEDFVPDKDFLATFNMVMNSRK